MHFPVAWGPKFQKVSPWYPTDSVYSKETQCQGKNGCRKKCLDKSLDEDYLIKAIENGFNSVKKTGETISSNLAKIINNVIHTPINKEKLVKKLESHPRPENIDLLKVKKCNTEIWSEMLQSKTPDLKI